MTGAASDGTEPALWRWLGETAGGRVTGQRRLTSGNSRTTWAADVDTGRAVQRLVVRVDEGDGPFSGTPLTLAREAGVYRALDGHGVRIPRFHGFDATLGALAIDRVEGSEEWGPEVVDAVLAELARLHSLDSSRLDLPDVGHRARDDLELWAGILAERVRPASPVAELAIERLREHFPGEPERVAMLHGDPGPFNLLWHQDRLAALLDWEFAHLGDPHDDLAFMTVRCGLFGLPLDSLAVHLARSYTPLTGLVPDPVRLRYWQIVGVLRNLVTCLCSISNPIRGRDRLVHFMLLPSLDRLLIGLLAELDGIDLEPAPTLPGPPPDLPGGDVLAELASEMPGIAAAIDDPERRQRAGRVRYLLAQLAETWPLAFAVAAADEAEAPAADLARRLRRLARIADRRLLLFPRARELAQLHLAGLEP